MANGLSDPRSDVERYTTCDCCAEIGMCLPDGDADICRKCRAQHEKALDLTTDTVMAHYALFRDPYYGKSELTKGEVKEIVALAVKTYFENGG